MLLQMLESNPPTSTSAIANFERNRGIALPSSYKRFLLMANGGVPVNSEFPIVGSPADRIGNVNVFLGIGVRWSTAELAYVYDLYEGGLPEGVVPIAGDDYGNYLCLDLRAATDKIVFWDKSHFWSTGEWREQDLYRVADSLVTFLGMLRPLSQ